jgi:hypothetical protein
MITALQQVVCRAIKESVLQFKVTRFVWERTVVLICKLELNQHDHNDPRRLSEECDIDCFLTIQEGAREGGGEEWIDPRYPQCPDVSMSEHSAILWV